MLSATAKAEMKLTVSLTLLLALVYAGEPSTDIIYEAWTEAPAIPQSQWANNYTPPQNCSGARLGFVANDGSGERACLNFKMSL